MTSAEDNWILKDQHTPTWTDSLPKSFHLWLPHWDSMVPWTLILPNSKPIWSHIPVSTLCWVHTLQLSHLRKLITNNSQLLKLPTLHSSQHQWSPNATQDMVNTWHDLCYIEVMLYQKMLTHQLPPSRPRDHLIRWLVPNWFQSWYQLSTTNCYSRRWLSQSHESCVHDF